MIDADCSLTTQKKTHPDGSLDVFPCTDVLSELIARAIYDEG